MKELFEYKKELDDLHFTPEQKAALAARVALAAQNTSPKRRRPLWRTALLVAALAAVLVVPAGASGLLQSAADAFAPIFGDKVAQTEVIDKIGRPIGASDTQGGVTITADAILGDAYNACILYTLSREDGEPLLPEGVPAESLALGGFGGAVWNGLGGSHGTAGFFDQEPGDNSLQYMETICADQPINKGTATAKFSDLCYYDGAGQRVPVAEGSWKFRFEVDYEDVSRQLGSGETFTQGGIGFTIDSVSVSPVAVRVQYTADKEVQWSNAPSGREDPEDTRQMELYLQNVEVLLTLADGTVLDLSNAGGSIDPENGKTCCTKSDVLSQVIPLEEMASISVGGVVYPLGAQ